MSNETPTSLIFPLSVPLTVAQFNVENLFVYMERYDGENLESLTERTWQKLSARSQTRNKPLKKLWGLEAAISEINPDILLLNEVGGRESLNNFNHFFLENRFNGFLHRGNSLRGIEVAALVKKELPFHISVRSHAHKPLQLLYEHEKVLPKAPRHLHSRDILELRFHNSQNDLLLIILLTHLKSKLDPDRIDPFGSLRREAEVRLLVDVYNSLSANNIPILVVGDFNGHAGSLETEHEFLPIYEHTDLVDCMDLTPKSPSERMTHTQIYPSGQVRELQIDYLFINRPFKNWVVADQTYVYRYKIDDVEIPIPKNLEQRMQLPSDHYPVVLRLKKPHF
ncbi:MAG: endonuclease/exonuclease/phosphatase family protein [Bdellovibrionales bacterium]|nr:endonuclease/exonuclease/phosphatase family protein [Bdellovibrionales bacterium]